MRPAGPCAFSPSAGRTSRRSFTAASRSRRTPRSSTSGSGGASSAWRCIRRRRDSSPFRRSRAAGSRSCPTTAIFYEFVPVEDLGSDRPRRHTVADVELHRPYAVVVTTPAGLWSYRPRRHRPVRAARSAAARHHRPRPPLRQRVRRERDRGGDRARARRRVPADRGRGRGVHGGAALPERGRAARRPRVAVEFRVPPLEPQDFARVLDETLRPLNADYRTQAEGRRRHAAAAR